MIDILVYKIVNKDGSSTYYYRKIEVCITDCHVLPKDAPLDSSLISANDWHSEAWVLSVPEIDPETGEKRTFEQREAILLSELNWIYAGQ